MYKNYLKKTDSVFDIPRVIANDEITNNMLENINKTVKEISIFWKEVSNSDKRGDTINELSETISLRIYQLKHEITKMETICKPVSMNLLELYIDFLENVIFNEQECFEFKEKLITMKKFNKFMVENPNVLVNNI